MIHEALHRPIPVELTDDRRIRRRVKRLAAVSAVALGLIWALAAATLDAPLAVDVALLAGWLLMPTILLASLRDARLRYGLMAPSVLVSFALLAIVLGWSPGGVAGVGWLMMLLGILLGGAMGLWFWFRVLPVPHVLDAPDAPGRWILIAVHVALVVVGLALAASALVAA
ncbi:MAG: hypothetical protein ABWY52_02170 [Candidatus Limnocylindrales bacterium]